MPALIAVSTVTGLAVSEMKADEGKLLRSRIRHLHLICHPDIPRNNNDTCRELAIRTCASLNEMVQRYNDPETSPATGRAGHPELAGGHAWGTNVENYWHPTAEHEEEDVDAAIMLSWWGGEL